MGSSGCYSYKPKAEQTLVCLPLSKYNKWGPHLETGDKVVMPPSSCLNLTTTSRLTFRIQTLVGRASHCGVLGFDADEGHVYVPDWMMARLELAQGDRVLLTGACLPKACFVRLRPHASSRQLPNAVLERALRGFTCLSRGDTFMVRFWGEYFFDVVDVGPGGRAVCMVDTTDCEIHMEDQELIKTVPFMRRGEKLDIGDEEEEDGEEDQPERKKKKRQHHLHQVGLSSIGT